MRILGILAGLLGLVFSTLGWCADLPDNTYVLSRKPHNGAVFYYLDEYTPSTGKQRQWLSFPSLNTNYIQQVILPRAMISTPVVALLSDQNVLSLHSLSGNLPISRKVYAITAKESDRLLAVGDNNEIFTVGSAGIISSGTVVAAGAIDPNTYGQIRHIDRIETGGLVVATNTHLLVLTIGHQGGKIPQSPTIDYEYAWNKLGLSNAKLKQIIAADEVAYILMDDSSPATGVTMRTIVKIDYRSQLNPHPTKISYNLLTMASPPVLELLDIDPQTHDLLYREDDDYYHLVASGGMEAIEKVSAFSASTLNVQNNPSFWAGEINVDHPRTGRSWFHRPNVPAFAGSSIPKQVAAPNKVPSWQQVVNRASQQGVSSTEPSPKKEEFKKKVLDPIEISDFHELIAQEAKNNSLKALSPSKAISARDLAEWVNATTVLRYYFRYVPEKDLKFYGLKFQVDGLVVLSGKENGAVMLSTFIPDFSRGEKQARKEREECEKNLGKL